MILQTIIPILITISTYAGTGDIGTGFRVYDDNTAKTGTGDIGSGFNISPSSDNTTNIIKYFDSLKDQEKEMKVIVLPSSYKLNKDRDFISPIDRWTLKTAKRDLLADSIERLWEYDDLSTLKLYDVELPEAEELSKRGFKPEDF